MTEQNDVCGAAARGCCGCQDRNTYGQVCSNKEKSRNCQEYLNQQESNYQLARLRRGVPQ